MKDKEWKTINEWLDKDPDNRYFGRVKGGTLLHLWIWEDRLFCDGGRVAKYSVQDSLELSDEYFKAMPVCKTCLILAEEG